MFDLGNLMCFQTGEKEEGLELFTKCVQKLPQVDTAWASWKRISIEQKLGNGFKCFETL